MIIIIRLQIQRYIQIIVTKNRLVIYLIKCNLFINLYIFRFYHLNLTSLHLIELNLSQNFLKLLFFFIFISFKYNVYDVRMIKNVGMFFVYKALRIKNAYVVIHRIFWYISSLGLNVLNTFICNKLFSSIYH